MRAIGPWSTLEGRPIRFLCPKCLDSALIIYQNQRGYRHGPHVTESPAKNASTDPIASKTIASRARMTHFIIAASHSCMRRSRSENRL
jgi:hypothetical protein